MQDKVRKPARKVAVKAAPAKMASKAAPVLAAPSHWPVGTRVVHLSDPEMKDVLADIKRRIKEEPGFGRSLLQSAGIVNAKGKLTKLYGG